ncbi:MAG: hypothetical protein NC420_15805 [Eubacterium sp.]|nr:hypothetical protein [Eubacterium sp.]MCM1217092.1 hypothetical protein [Lachnospiraceae bacterium]MCM1305335.1 hypothetical protein [Butyrivibrio sp.]MCM1344956.1 hypothetical protein [Muribaculaceae bacterium]MCM1412104.1 hypothetical protein [Lachnospiraceae bacterium]
MLRKCTEQDYRKYADAVYGLALDPSRSGYPTYGDGIKTKEMFFERAEKAFSRETEEILLFEYEGAVEGWIHYYSLPEDNYLSTVSFNIDSHTEIALQEFLDFAQEQFKGYDLFLGYSKDNRAAINFLSNSGFECIEEDYNNTAFLDHYEPVAVTDSVVRVTKENYGHFRNLHSHVESEMYWNSERIYADIDNWIILARICNGEAVGSVYYMTNDDGWFEIFGMDRKEDAFDPELFGELLGKALNTARELGGKFMTFFCNKQEQEIVGKLGFECVGEHVCYKKHLV